MRSAAVSIVLLLGLTAWAIGPSAEPPQLVLSLAADDWGEATHEDVRRVLQSAGRELTQHFAGLELPALAVSPHGGPMVLHERRADGAVQILLDTGDTYWSQYAFQFSHELCHVLCGFKDHRSSNQWFEESLCEMASLYVLRRMSRTWETKPPYPKWRPYAPRLADYSRQRTQRARLPDGQTLAAWYRSRADRLSREATNREWNLVVATALLPDFEARPEHWQAIQWLNAGAPAAPQSFADYLQAWHDHAAPRHREFVRTIAGRFEIALSAEATQD